MKNFSIISVAAAFVAASICVAGATAAAAVEPTPVQVEVSYADLDLASPAGQAKLEQRLKQAARQACGDPAREREIGVRRDMSQCFRSAMAKAETDVAAISAPVFAAR